MMVDIMRISDGKVFTLEQYALMEYKKGAHIIYCDIEGVYQNVEDDNDYILADECGNHLYIDSSKYQVIPSKTLAD